MFSIEITLIVFNDNLFQLPQLIALKRVSCALVKLSRAFSAKGNVDNIFIEDV